MSARDKAYYVVKFKNCPQGIRILANEFLASRLGLWLGLPMAHVEIIEVSEWLIEHTPELRIELAGSSVACSSGLQVGSRYVSDPGEDEVFDYLPESLFLKVRNLTALAHVLVLDKWTANCDGRQAVFSKKRNQRSFAATLVDQGYCFNAQDWTFPDSALRGVYARNCVYEHISGWDAFEPILTRAEESDLSDLWRCAKPIPPEWYGGDSSALERLVETLYQRRRLIRSLIAAFRDSSRNPFPHWRKSGICSVAVSSACVA